MHKDTVDDQVAAWRPESFVIIWCGLGSLTRDTKRNLVKQSVKMPIYCTKKALKRIYYVFSWHAFSGCNWTNFEILHGKFPTKIWISYNFSVAVYELQLHLHEETAPKWIENKQTENDIYMLCTCKRTVT